MNIRQAQFELINKFLVICLYLPLKAQNWQNSAKSDQLFVSQNPIMARF